MNWAWTTSLDYLWRSPSFAMWVTLAAAGFFGIIVLITLIRAEKSVANGALTVITLLAVGIAAAATIRGSGPAPRGSSDEIRLAPATTATASLPALACIDDLAGDAVLAGCEKALFGSAEAAASAVSYTASQVSRLTVLGDVAAANPKMTPELLALRRAVEHDRYGLVAQVLQTRDHCTPTECAAFAALTDSRQIVANMDAHVYDDLVTRYAPSWNAPPPVNPVAMLGASVPTGRPTNAEFPSASSTPAVSIMTAEPGTGAAAAASQRAATTAPAATASTPAPRPTPAAPAAVPAAAKKPPAPKRAPAPAPATVSAPTQLSPTASTPAASND